MSAYSEDFDCSPQNSDNEEKEKPKIKDEVSHESYNSEVFSQKSISVDSHQEKFEKNLQALREEIKALEIEQLQNLETIDSGETLEIQDDSSEDDMNYIKKRQAAIIKRLRGSPRSKSKPQVSKNKDMITCSREKSNVLKNYSFNEKIQKKKNYITKTKDLLQERGIYHAKPKQIISAMPDIRYLKKRKVEPSRPMKLSKALESYNNDVIEKGPD